MYIYTLQGYFRESYLTEQAKVKLHFDGVGPGSLANIIYYLHLFAKKQPFVLRTDSVMLAACLLGYYFNRSVWKQEERHEVIYDHLAGND